MSLFLKKNLHEKCWRKTISLLNEMGALTLCLLLKLPPEKLERRFVYEVFFLLRLLFIFINLPYGLVWNTVLLSLLLLPSTT